VSGQNVIEQKAVQRTLIVKELKNVLMGHAKFQYLGLSVASVANHLSTEGVVIKASSTQAVHASAPTMMVIVPKIWIALVMDFYVTNAVATNAVQKTSANMVCVRLYYRSLFSTLTISHHRPTPTNDIEIHHCKDADTFSHCVKFGRRTHVHTRI
jgi:hypothetical protein